MAVSFVVMCAQCRREVLEADLIGDEEECILRDHPRTIQPGTPRRAAQALRRDRGAAAGRVSRQRASVARDPERAQLRRVGIVSRRMTRLSSQCPGAWGRCLRPLPGGNRCLRRGGRSCCRRRLLSRRASRPYSGRLWLPHGLLLRLSARSPALRPRTLGRLPRARRSRLPPSPPLSHGG